jgi:hypothetical protein
MNIEKFTRNIIVVVALLFAGACATSKPVKEVSLGRFDTSSTPWGPQFHFELTSARTLECVYKYQIKKIERTTNVVSLAPNQFESVSDLWMVAAKAQRKIEHTNVYDGEDFSVIWRENDVTFTSTGSSLWVISEAPELERLRAKLFTFLPVSFSRVLHGNASEERDGL